MASFTIFGDETLSQILDDGDSGIVGQNGALLVTGDDAILGSGVNSLQIIGSVSAQDPYGYVDGFYFDGDVMLVGLARSGSLTASSTGIDAVVSTFASIDNAGVISGFEDAIYVWAAGGGSGPGGNALIEISNTGAILGGYSAVSVELEEGSRAVIRNAGKMVSDVTAIDVWITPAMIPLTSSLASTAPNGGLRLFNSGQIISSHGPAVWASEGRDKVYNSGLIGGDVNLSRGNDLYQGEGGRVSGWVEGRSGNDVLKGGGHADRLAGGSGNDHLNGRGSDDRLAGGSGSDVVAGGRGNDALFGGGGDDLFVFALHSGNDTVFDYSDGIDRLSFRAFGFHSKAEALSHFSDVGGAHDDRVSFDFKGTHILIKGADLADIGHSDLLV
ncbi:MAG: hypothetical protein H6873_12110 [Hyphomicrobiaceae bacterium]|nr:hypothetical protein [Hyphomicrobiaceae bacterium]